MKSTSIALLLSLSLLWGCSDKPKDSAEIVSIQQELKKSPQDWQRRFELVEKFEEEERYVEAIDEIKIILKANPKDPRVLSKLSNLYYKNKDMDQALENGQQILNDNPAEGAGYEALGRLHFNRGEYKSAEENLRRSIQLGNWTEKSSLHILHQLGLSKMKLGDEEKGLEIFHKIIEKDPFHEETLFFLSLDHFKRQQWKETEVYLKRLISKEKEDYRYYLILGLAGYHQSKWSLCQENLRKATDLEPGVRSLSKIADVANISEIPHKWDLALVVRFGETNQYKEKGNFVVQGSAINIGFRIAKDARANIDFYNKERKLVNDETVYLKPRNLLPMQIRDYKVVVSNENSITDAKVRFNWKKSSLYSQGGDN